MICPLQEVLRTALPIALDSRDCTSWNFQGNMKNIQRVGFCWFGPFVWSSCGVYIVVNSHTQSSRHFTGCTKTKNKTKKKHRGVKGRNRQTRIQNCKTQEGEVGTFSHFVFFCYVWPTRQKSWNRLSTSCPGVDYSVDRCESSLVDNMARFDLVDRFRLDHPGWKMWTWIDSLSFVNIKFYLYRGLVRGADPDFVSCLTFHWIWLTQNKLVWVNLRS